MAYSKVFLRKSGKALLKYAIGKDAKGHNGKERRNEVIGYVNLVPGVDVATQMQQYWDKMKSGHKNQMIHVIQSFSKKEFNRFTDGKSSRSGVCTAALSRQTGGSVHAD